MSTQKKILKLEQFKFWKHSKFRKIPILEGSGI